MENNNIEVEEKSKGTTTISIQQTNQIVIISIFRRSRINVQDKSLINWRRRKPSEGKEPQHRYSGRELKKAFLSALIWEPNTH